MEVDERDGSEEPVAKAAPGKEDEQAVIEEAEEDADDPARSIPLTRYNAMLAVVKNTLFM